MGKTMGKVVCAWIVLLAAGCGQGPDAFDPAAEPGASEEALAVPAPAATNAAVPAPGPQLNAGTPFCSNDALPARGQAQHLVQQGASFPEPDPFYRAPQDEDEWRRLIGASAPTLAPENGESVNESAPGSAE
jgi:hypothetical protein